MANTQTNKQTNENRTISSLSAFSFLFFRLVICVATEGRLNIQQYQLTSLPPTCPCYFRSFVTQIHSFPKKTRQWMDGCAPPSLTRMLCTRVIVLSHVRCGHQRDCRRPPSPPPASHLAPERPSLCDAIHPLAGGGRSAGRPDSSGTRGGGGEVVGRFLDLCPRRRQHNGYEDPLIPPALKDRVERELYWSDK